MLLVLVNRLSGFLSFVIYIVVVCDSFGFSTEIRDLTSILVFRSPQP